MDLDADVVAVSPEGAGALGDDRLVAEAVALAERLLVDGQRATTRSQRRRSERLGRLAADPDGLALALALTDEVTRIDDPARAARSFADVVRRIGVPATLGPVDRTLLRAGALLAPRAPWLVGPLLARRIRREARGVVLPAEDPAFTRHLARRRAQGIVSNVNVLGEAVLGEEEASRRFDAVMERVRRPDVSYVSVKVSSICSQLNVLAFDAEVERVAGRLRALYEAAQASTPQVFVNLDMEEHRDLELTVTVFQRVLDEPSLLDLPAGIVLQAYLPDSHAAAARLAEWARQRRQRGGAPVKVRLVKGANLAMEQVEAEVLGWPQAPYTSKAEADASYKRLLDVLLDPATGDALRIGVASHNLFDIGWAIVRAREAGALARVDIEMLEGMAEGQARAVTAVTGGLVLYTPIASSNDMTSAIAYLVRRLEENTAPENFLRDLFRLAAGSEAFRRQRDRFVASVASRHDVGTQPRHDQDRPADEAGGRRFDPEAPFGNEPDTDLSLPANRAWAAGHLAAFSDAAAAGPREVALQVAGRDRQPNLDGSGLDPSASGRLLYRYALADRELVDEAVATAHAAQARWGATPAAERRRLLTGAAEEMARQRGRSVAAMAFDAGKTVVEADAEVSEAIDFARWYAAGAAGLERPDALAEPLGTVVVTPPWNFPYAIPAGGVLSALAAGNTVILKPATETVLTARLLAEHLWAGGIPKDVLQLVPCPDDEVGQRLVTHPDVDAVVLTGAVATARLFQGWRPGLTLLAETSGKNAIVVTAAADLDLAARDIVRSAFGHAGQKCSAASLAIVEASVYDAGGLARRIADATSSLVVGPAWELTTSVGPVIRPPEEELQAAFSELDEGERWLVEPRRLDDAGYLWRPGVKLGVQPGSRFHLREAFGPVLGILRADDLDHAISLQNQVAFGLTGGIHSLDDDEVETWLERVEVGNAYVNRHITGAIVGRQPFGGWKSSSVGPTAKAGGPHHLSCLVRWSDPEGTDRLAAARASYPPAWAELRQPVDRSGLRAEANVLRHRPLPPVLVRIDGVTPAEDVELCRLAAATVGVDLEVADDDDAIVDILRSRPPGRLRDLAFGSAPVLRAAAEAGVDIDRRSPVAAGEIEIPRWCREQAISETRHRYGNVRERRFAGT